MAHFENLTVKQRQELADTFSVFDKNGDGKVTFQEFKDVINKCEPSKSDADIRQMFDYVDKDGSGWVNCQELYQYLSQLKQGGTASSREFEMQQLFKQFDKNGDGKITKQELYTVLTSLGEQVSKKDVEQMIKDVDADRDGYVQYEEFKKMMQSQ